jgi:hypothetical protein
MPRWMSARSAALMMPWRPASRRAPASPGYRLGQALVEEHRCGVALDEIGDGSEKRADQASPFLQIGLSYWEFRRMGDYSKHNCARPRQCSRKCCGARIFRICQRSPCTLFRPFPHYGVGDLLFAWMKCDYFRMASFLLVVFAQVFLQRKTLVLMTKAEAILDWR